MTPEIKTFLQAIIEESDQKALPQDIKDLMLEDLYSRLEQRMILTVVEKLSIEKQDQLDEMIKNNAAPKEVQKFLTTSIPNYQEVMQQVLLEFKEMYLGGEPGSEKTE